MIRKGDEWAIAAAGPADLAVAGGDSELATVLRDHHGALVELAPGESDLVRAVGLTSRPSGASEVAVDALLADGELVVNMIVAGRAPDRVRRLTRSRRVEVLVDGRIVFDGRATTVVVANGQFRRGMDLVPDGHPGDGRLEVQVYALPASARGAMRRRLATGSHVPHPAITTARGRRVDLVLDRGWPIEADLVARPGVSLRRVEVVPAAFRLLL